MPWASCSAVLTNEGEHHGNMVSKGIKVLWLLGGRSIGMIPRGVVL
jgi:hypothetical protein